VEVVSGLSPEADPVVVTKGRLTSVLLCEAHAATISAADSALTDELVLGVLVDVIFRQWVSLGEIGDPLHDALDGVGASPDGSAVLAYVDRLSPDVRVSLAAELERHARTIQESWRVPPATWLARTQERVSIPVAGGLVRLSGVFDLAMGGPARKRSSVCIVEVKSGRPRAEHRLDLHLYALLETLRSSAPPFVVATYYSGTGQLVDEAIDERSLKAAVERTIDGASRLVRIAAGSDPERSPNPLCPWCPERTECAPDLRFGRSTTGRSPLDEGPPNLRLGIPA
jgi:hypothetical protein